MSTSIKLLGWAVFTSGMLFGAMLAFIPELVMRGLSGLTLIFTVFAFVALHLGKGAIDDIAHDVKEMEDGEPRS